jgi:hypothetical protein
VLPIGSVAHPTRTRRQRDDEVATTVPGAAPGQRGPYATWAILVAYLALGLCSNLPAWLDGPTRTVQAAAQGDVGQEIWFLGWVPAAISHGLDPLVTHALNVPWGVDLMDNTSMPLAGLLGWPVTAAFGPIATYNVLFSLAVASSAASAFFVLRRYVTRDAAAFVGGLCYGCSPYVVAQGQGHLFLVLVPLLPLFLLLLDEALVRQRRRPVVTGALLGLCGAAQLLLSVELLAWAVVVGVVGVAYLALTDLRRARAQLAQAWRALAVALAVFAALAAFPLTVYFDGPAHLDGPVHPSAILQDLSADVASFVVPTSNQAVTAGMGTTGDRYVYLRDGPPLPEPAEAGSYLGLPLIVLLVAGAVRFRRDRTLRFALAMALAAAVLSLGPHLRVAGHDTGVPMPFIAIERLPVAGSGVAARFAALMWLFVAMALAVVLDRAADGLARRPQRAWGRLAGGGALAVLLGATAATLVPAWPYAFGQTLVPAWFTSSAVRRVPKGTVLLTYPVARSDFSLPMVWQALDGFRYDMPGGEAAVPGHHVSRMERIFEGCLVGSGRNPPIGPQLVGELRHQLAARRVSIVVVPDAVAGSSCADAYVEAVAGRPPDRVDGASVWWHVGNVGP